MKHSAALLITISVLHSGCSRPPLSTTSSVSDNDLIADTAQEKLSASEPTSDTVQKSAPPKKRSAKSPRSIDELFLFQPSKYPAGNWKPAGLRFEDVWMKTKDNKRLHGWYCPAPKPRACLLFAHGNAGNISHRSRLLLKFQNMGITTLTFDYRGYGRSEGKPSKVGIVEDGAVARAKLAELVGVPKSDVVLMGRSLGGAVAIQLAAQSPARGLIVESSFSSVKDMAKHLAPALSWLVKRDSLNSIDALPKHQGPLLQSHGDADQLIPIEQGRALFKCANEPKQFVLIKNGGHNTAQTAEYYQAFTEFIDSLE